MKDVGKKVNDVLKCIIDDYKTKDLIITSIEILVSPGLSPELRIQYFSMNKKEMFSELFKLHL